MARKLKTDKWLWMAMLLLVCTGVVMVYSASAQLGEDKANDQYLFLFKQGTWALLGVFLVPFIMKVDYRYYRQPVVIWTGLAVVCLALVAVLFGREVNGARRWLNIGGLGIQPSELAKIVVIFFTAALLERRMERINEPAHALVPIGVVLSTMLVLILLEPDFGTAACIVAIAGVMIFAAGLSPTYIVAATLAAVPALYILIVSSEYRMRRVTAFLDPWAVRQEDGYQVVQSMIAVGVGGIVGRGLMDGVQKRGYLPEPHNDFIFAVISEELGLLGATLVVGCFGVIAWRGMRTALRAPDRFGAFLALGITTMIAFQAFFNISVALGLLPTKGIPLPFISAGGSSLLINLLAMGILLNVSQHASSSHVVTTAMPTADA